MFTRYGGLARNLVVERSSSFVRCKGGTNEEYGTREMRDALLMAVISNALRRLLSRFMPSLRIPVRTRWKTYDNYPSVSKDGLTCTMLTYTRTLGPCTVPYVPSEALLRYVNTRDNNRRFVIFRRLPEPSTTSSRLIRRCGCRCSTSCRVSRLTVDRTRFSSIVTTLRTTM